MDAPQGSGWVGAIKHPVEVRILMKDATFTGLVVLSTWTYLSVLGNWCPAPSRWIARHQMSGVRLGAGDLDVLSSLVCP